MKKFKYLDHTSEAKFQAYGKSLEEAFANAALAMVNIMTKVEEVKPEKEKEIKLESSSLESLLYDFLDEVLYIVDVDLMFPCKFEDLKITKAAKYTLTGKVTGGDASKHPKGGEVKAPTYDEMKIEETKKGWVVQAVVDV